jgi:hypothetical protein
MTTATVSFPQYRMYKNGKSYFKISSASEFEEIQVIGSRYFFHAFTAKILPDRNLIHDMLNDYGTNWVQITDSEFQAAKSRVKEE